MSILRPKSQSLHKSAHGRKRLPGSLIEIIRRSLQGEAFVPVGQAFEVVASYPHGHVQAVAAAMQRLGFASLLAVKPSREPSANLYSLRQTCRANGVNTYAQGAVRGAALG